MQFCTVMKKYLVLLMMLTVMSVTGCDFFRTLAGRPTSEEVENKRIVLLREEERALQTRLDSLKREEKLMADSLAMVDSVSILDSIKLIRGTIHKSSSLSPYLTELTHRHYIVVGTFSRADFARNMATRVSDRGYEPVVIEFKNGKRAIAVCPVNNIQDAYRSLRQVKEEPFCPPDVWILTNE